MKFDEPFDNFFSASSQDGEENTLEQTPKKPEGKHCSTLHMSSESTKPAHQISNKSKSRKSSMVSRLKKERQEKSGKHEDKLTEKDITSEHSKQNSRDAAPDDSVKQSKVSTNH